jgi:DNA phosphorothioation-associated DGQHR protein 1
MNNMFLELISIKINQPLSTFFLTKIAAKDLLQISFSEELQYKDEDGRLKGSQRKLDPNRLKEIARYIDSVEMAFPNSIILAANYNKEDGEVTKDDQLRWRINENGDNSFKIIIPTNKPLAAVIDGQHRLKAFQYVSKKERQALEIPCSIFFDLPNSYQAFLFATINGNQKKVDKSLALEQFGFNVEDEPPKSWTPEKLAVYFSRKLNLQKSSPLYQHIKVAPIDDNILFKESKNGKWVISTGTVVDGILGLISTNPKRDRVEMGQEYIFKGRSRNLIEDIKDSSPLRNFFLENRDDDIFNVIINYFNSLTNVLLHKQGENSYLIKTVGIQALFDVLKEMLKQNLTYTTEHFNSGFNKFINVNFSDNYFQASGVGRNRIKNLFLYGLGYLDAKNIKNEDLVNLKRLIG